MKEQQPTVLPPAYRPDVLSATHELRKLDVLATLAATPLQSAANLALHFQVSLRTMWRDLSWLMQHGFVESYLPRGCGAGNTHLFYLSRGGLALLYRLQRRKQSPADATGTAGPLACRTFPRPQYHRQLLRMVPRLPHYVQLQELGDWLSTIWREHQSPGTDPTPGEIPTTTISWRWLRDARLGLAYHGRQTTCPLDALAIAIRDRRGQERHATTALLCVYLDDGAASLCQLSRRLRQLLRFRHEHGIAAEDFPRVLIRTASRHRAWQWARAAAHSADRLGVEPLQGLLLFPAVPPAHQHTHLDSPPAAAFEPAWPFIVDGLPAGPEAKMLSARALCWQPSMIEPYRNVAPLTRLAFVLFKPQDPEILQTCCRALQLPARAQPLTYQDGHLRISPPRARKLLLSNCLAFQRTRQQAPPILSNISESPGPLHVAESMSPQTGTQIPRRQGTAEYWNTLTPRDRQRLLADLCLRLERRQLALLALIAAQPLISHEDLASLTQMPLRSLADGLRLLRHLGLIEAVVLPAPRTGFPGVGWQHHGPAIALAPPVSYTPLRCLRLLDLGSHLLASVYNRPVSSVPFHERTVQRPTSHDTGIRRFLGLLIRQTREYASVPVSAAPSAMLTEWGRQLVWWSSAPAVRLRFPGEGEMVTLLPDAAGELQFRATSPEKTPTVARLMQSIFLRRFWLEWDAGTENTRDLWDKLATYQGYARSQECVAPERILPALLIVTPEERQEQRIVRIMTELAARQAALTKSPVSWGAGRQPQPAVVRHRAAAGAGKAEERTAWWQAGQGWSESQGESHVVGLRIWVTTTYELGMHGPLGSCWLGAVL
ncbi:MAG: hypothetical protein ACLQUY_00685 [Ktedonobacterales bacterium]